MERLNRLTQSILAQELNKAFFKAGKRLLTIYLEELSETQALAICRSPALLRDTVEKLLIQREQEAAATDSQSPIKKALQTRNFPRTATRELLKFLEETIHNSPLEGLSIDEVLKVVKHKTGRTMKHSTLLGAIRRNNDFHKLVIRGNRVRLRSDIMVDILAQRHRQPDFNQLERERKAKRNGPVDGKSRKRSSNS
jgi:hypothetical protein